MFFASGFSSRDLHGAYFCTGGAAPQPALQRLDALPRAARVHFDPTVIEIASIAREPQRPGLLLRGGTEEHALHLAADEKFRVPVGVSIHFTDA